jgi:hypothetical protein
LRLTTNSYLVGACTGRVGRLLALGTSCLDTYILTTSSES